MNATRYLVIGIVVVLAGITGVLIHQGNEPVAGADGLVTVTDTSTVAGGAAGNGSGTTDRAGGTKITGKPATPAKPAAAATNIPMKKLKAGEKAPQFIIFSFDGAGNHEKWAEFLAAAKPTNSRFTGFLTGLYLLTDDNKDRYTGPGHKAGRSSVGFGGTGTDVANLINDLNKAYAAGHEIGTHYNGHFCSGNDPSGKDWDTANWNDELNQFFGFLKNYKVDNPGVTLPALKVPAGSIKGGRTPCLEGHLADLIPAWKAHGMTYDSSINSPSSGISWPADLDGIWEFYMPYVYSPGFNGMVVNMDYNMWAKYNGGQDDPSSAPDLRAKVYQTYTYLYDQTYNGNRAPLLIANHFNDWNGNSFNPSVQKFMTGYCGKPNTYCTTYSDVIAWMKLQDPAVLKSLQDQAPVASAKP